VFALRFHGGVTTQAAATTATQQSSAASYGILQKRRINSKAILAIGTEEDMSGEFKRAGILFVATIVSTQAQWLNYPAPGTPRTRDGKPDLSAKAPRASNGKPDLSGVWQTQFAPPGENERLFGQSVKDSAVPGDDPRTFSKYVLNILSDFKPEESPLRPEAAELFRRNVERRGTQNEQSPTAWCLPQGLPRGDLFNYAPFKIIQTPAVLAVLYELDNTYRQIYTDGRKLPVDPQPAWVGYSVGHWEGDTLVVDAAGFNEKTWLDASVTRTAKL
jgi:hypothetical protein